MDAGVDRGLMFTAPGWPNTEPQALKKITSKVPSHQASSFRYPDLSQLPAIAKIMVTLVEDGDPERNPGTEQIRNPQPEGHTTEQKKPQLPGSEHEEDVLESQQARSRERGDDVSRESVIVQNKKQGADRRKIQREGSKRKSKGSVRKTKRESALYRRT